MKIIIAAAGKGTRMQELTKDKPKHLIEVNGKPFLFYLLENVKKAGFTEIIVVGGYQIEKMAAFLNSYDKNILLIDQNKKIKDKYGSICPLLTAQEVLKGEQFVLVSGDNLYAVEDLLMFNNLDKENNYLGAIIQEQPEKYGVLETGGDYLNKIIEKPEKYFSNLVNAGIYKFNQEIFSKINAVKISSRGEYELTDAVNLLAKEQKIKIVKLQKYWYDFGSKSDIKKIENFLSNEKN